jgi:hypothetical protein
MTSISPTTWELARRLIALEAPRDAGPDASESQAGRVCEKLRQPLARFAGVAGYRSLISRAVAMAKAKAPLLEPLQVQSDGSLQGFHGVEQSDGEAGTVVVVYLLSLLVEFIGTPLTISLVRDAWPDASLDQLEWGAEEKS